MAIYRKKRVGRGNMAGLTVGRYASAERVTREPSNGLIPLFRAVARAKQFIRNYFYDSLHDGNDYLFEAHYYGSNSSKNYKRGVTWLYTEYRKFMIYQYYREVFVYTLKPPYDHISYHAWRWGSSRLDDRDIIVEVMLMYRNFIRYLDKRRLMSPRKGYPAFITEPVATRPPYFSLVTNVHGAYSPLAGKDDYTETEVYGKGLCIARKFFAVNGVQAHRWLIGFYRGYGSFVHDTYRLSDYEEEPPRWGFTPPSGEDVTFGQMGYHFAIRFSRGSWAAEGTAEPESFFRLILNPQPAYAAVYPDRHWCADYWIIVDDDILPREGPTGSSIDISDDPLFVQITPMAGLWSKDEAPAINPGGTGGLFFRINRWPGRGRFVYAGVYDNNEFNWADITNGLHALGTADVSRVEKDATTGVVTVFKQGKPTTDATFSDGEAIGVVHSEFPGWGLLG